MTRKRKTPKAKPEAPKVEPEARKPKVQKDAFYTAKGADPKPKPINPPFHSSH